MEQSGANSAGLPYLGSKISLISNAEIRYEGILYSINTYESTVALQNVRTFGTEGRRQPEVLPNNKTYQFIIFKGKDIKDLTVCEPANVPEDPAIVTVNVPPTNTGMMVGQSPGFPPRHGGDGGPGGRPFGGNNAARGQRQSPGAYPVRGNDGSGGMRGYYNHPSYPNEMDYGGGRGGRYGATRPSRGANRNVGRGGGPRRVVGELPPQINHAVVKEVQKAFDFEGSNAKFDKADLANATIEPPKEGEAAEGEVPPVTLAPPTAGYNKTNSFFDRISCETLDRQVGKDARMDRDKQRQLDCDTFGAAAADASRGLRSRRGYRRGGQARRGGFNYAAQPVRTAGA